MKIDKCELCKNEIDYSQGFYSKNNSMICLDCYMYTRRKRNRTKNKIDLIIFVWLFLSMLIFVWFVIGIK